MRIAGIDVDAQTQPGFVKAHGIPDAFQEEPGTPAWQRSRRMCAELREKLGRGEVGQG